MFDKSGTDQVAGRIGKAADVELIADRHPVEEDCDAISGDSTNVDAFGAEAGTVGFVVDTGGVPKHVGDGIGEFEAKILGIEDADIGRDFPAFPPVLAGDDDHFVYDRSVRIHVSGSVGTAGCGRGARKEHADGQHVHKWHRGGRFVARHSCDLIAGCEGNKVNGRCAATGPP